MDLVFRPHLEHCPNAPTQRRKEKQLQPTCPFMHSQLCVVTPPTFSPSPLSPLIWSTGSSHQAAEGGPCALALSSFFSSTAWQSARGRIKEGNIRWRNLLRNLPVFGEKHGCRRYVYLVMRDRYDVTHPKALSGLSCKAQGFLGSCPTPAEALGGVQRHQCSSTVGTQRTHTVFFLFQAFLCTISPARRMGPFTCLMSPCNYHEVPFFQVSRETLAIMFLS